LATLKISFNHKKNDCLGGENSMDRKVVKTNHSGLAAYSRNLEFLEINSFLQHFMAEIN
jgi:hypothetical protein